MTVTRTFVRRTALSASMTRKELAAGANNHPAALRGLNTALVGLYAALHGGKASVSTAVCTQTDTRWVTLAGPPGAGVTYATEGETRLDAAMLLVDDLAAALKAGKPFGELLAR